MIEANEEQVNEMRKLIDSSYKKGDIYLKISPFDLMKKFNLSYSSHELGGIQFNSENYPKNLIYDENLIFPDDLFYGSQCNDTTLWYFYESSKKRLLSLISKAIYNNDKKIEHGPIVTLPIEGGCPKSYQVRSATFISFREILEE